jgi:hypothetical protein
VELATMQQIMLMIVLLSTAPAAGERGIFFNSETKGLPGDVKSANKLLNSVLNKVSLMHACPPGCNAASEGFRLNVALAPPVSSGADAQLKASCSCTPDLLDKSIAAAVGGAKGDAALVATCSSSFDQVIAFLFSGLKESSTGAGAALGLSALVWSLFSNQCTSNRIVCPPAYARLCSPGSVPRSR